MLFLQSKIGMFTIASIIVLLALSRFIFSNLYNEQELEMTDKMYGLKPHRVKRDIY